VSHESTSRAVNAAPLLASADVRALREALTLADLALRYPTVFDARAALERLLELVTEAVPYLR
jgi:hypothetical protein